MAEEIIKKSENTSTDKKQPLSLEQQKQLKKEKEQVLMLSKIQLGKLSEVTITNYLKEHHNIDLSKYSQENKQKFIEEIQIIFSEFKDFDESMVTRLREIREDMSFGMESGKTNEYYRNMILDKKIDTRILIIQESLKTINGKKE